jgi:hypothetical protein
VACFRPIKAWHAAGGGATFNRREAFTDLPELELGCGQCIGCRLDRSRAWAVRCVHEAQFHEDSSFLTLTYRDRDLPSDGSLQRDAFPLFMRRLRKAHPELRRRLKYFHCGEYGDELGRPHYHAILFGYAFPDRRHWKTSPQGFAQYSSVELDAVWGHGYCSTGPVTFETAAYVARYVCKKVNGQLGDAHYLGREPEFMTCSKGIGERWIATYAADTLRDDFVVARGHEQPLPRYYRKKLADGATSESQAQQRKHELRRISRANTPQAKFNRTEPRLAVREEVTAGELAIKGRQ